MKTKTPKELFLSTLPLLPCTVRFRWHCETTPRLTGSRQRTRETVGIVVGIVAVRGIIPDYLANKELGKSYSYRCKVDGNADEAIKRVSFLSFHRSFQSFALYAEKKERKGERKGNIVFTAQVHFLFLWRCLVASLRREIIEESSAFLFIRAIVYLPLVSKGRELIQGASCARRIVSFREFSSLFSWRSQCREEQAKNLKAVEKSGTRSCSMKLWITLGTVVGVATLNRWNLWRWL